LRDCVLVLAVLHYIDVTATLWSGPKKKNADDTDKDLLAAERWRPPQAKDTP